MQADGGLWKIVGHNTDKYKEANHFNNIGEKISALKSDLTLHSKVIDINNVVKKDAHHSKSKFTLHSRVAIGNADFEVMTTSNRQGR